MLIHTWRHINRHGEVIGEIRRYQGRKSKVRDVCCHLASAAGFQPGFPSEVGESENALPLFGLQTIVGNTRPLYVTRDLKAQAALAGLGMQVVAPLPVDRAIDRSRWTDISDMELVCLVHDNTSAEEKYAREIALALFKQPRPPDKLRVHNLPKSSVESGVIEWLTNQAELSSWNGYEDLSNHPAKAALVVRFLKVVRDNLLNDPDGWIHSIPLVAGQQERGASKGSSIIRESNPRVPSTAVESIATADNSPGRERSVSGPEPLVPLEANVRRMPYMPIEPTRLLDSDLFALSTGDEFKAAVALWCKAWLQVPAGSLPSGL